MFPYLVSAALVAIAGVAAYGLAQMVPFAHVSIVFIAAVLTSAALWGFLPSVFAALLSAAAEAFFFYSPILSFRVADAQQVVDLVVFLVIAALTSWLAATVREQALEAHRRQEALREALLNSVSHDLQTPVAAILGSATALESFGEPGDARARRELLGGIRDQAERLASTIENVLDLTRIRAGQLAARLEMVELADIVNAALRRKEKALAGHELRVRLPADLPMLRLDLFLMEHALANVLGNAAKYSPPGSPIELAACLEGREVVLEVADRGSGIRAEDLPRVFEPFFRGSAPQAAPAPGSGLGLAICRAFVAANGGSVEAASPGEGRGSTLRLRLPVPRDAPALSDD
jgi:two-component system, OmpR family, sensor histidine kinase KdpD